jgi:hypothetical protein
MADQEVSLRVRLLAPWLAAAGGFTDSNDPNVQLAEYAVLSLPDGAPVNDQNVRSVFVDNPSDFENSLRTVGR